MSRSSEDVWALFLPRLL